jgi:hypothetical protein
MKFSVVKSYILATGDENGKIVLWDLNDAKKKKCEM